MFWVAVGIAIVGCLAAAVEIRFRANEAMDARLRSIGDEIELVATGIDYLQRYKYKKHASRFSVAARQARALKCMELSEHTISDIASNVDALQESFDGAVKNIPDANRVRLDPKIANDASIHWRQKLDMLDTTWAYPITSVFKSIWNLTTLAHGWRPYPIVRYAGWIAWAMQRLRGR